MNKILKKLFGDFKVEWKKISEIALVSGAGVDKKIIKGEKKIKLLNYMDVYRNPYLNINIPNMEVTAKDIKIKQCNILKGDIFITPSSEVKNEIGFSAMAIEDMLGVVYSYHIMRIRLNEYNLIQSMFINYLFRSDALQKQINKQAKGLTRFGLTKTQWENILIPIPPLKVQKKIVEILDNFTELTAELTAELSLRKKQYEFYRDKLLTFSNDEVEWKKLGEVGEFVRGNGLPKKDFTENGVPAIHYGQIYTYYGLSTTKTISFVSFETAKKLKKVNKGDVIITNTSENFEDVGKALVYLGEEQAVTGGHATIFKPSNQILEKYFAYFTQTNTFTKEKRKYAKGTKVIDVSATDMAKIKIPIPPIEKQKEIVSILDKFDTLTNSISEGLPKEIELREKQYEYYRDILLSFPKENNE